MEGANPGAGKLCGGTQFPAEVIRVCNGVYMAATTGKPTINAIAHRIGIGDRDVKVAIRREHAGNLGQCQRKRGNVLETMIRDDRTE